MMRGMFAAISGLKNHQVMLDVTANDIANVNTIGYKSSRVSFLDPTTSTRVTPYKLTLATFPNAAGLERQGGNRWKVSANSGTPTVNTPGNGGAGSTTAGALEMSNVDLAQTFTNMITAQRG